MMFFGEINVMFNSNQVKTEQLYKMDTEYTQFRNIQAEQKMLDIDDNLKKANELQMVYEKLQKMNIQHKQLTVSISHPSIAC